MQKTILVAIAIIAIGVTEAVLLYRGYDISPSPTLIAIILSPSFAVASRLRSKRSIDT
jgi:hypothetical protein